MTEEIRSKIFSKLDYLIKNPKHSKKDLFELKNLIERMYKDYDFYLKVKDKKLTDG